MKQILLLVFMIVISSPVLSMDSINTHSIVSSNLTPEGDDDFTLLTNPVKDGVLKLRVNKTTTKNVAVTIINSLGEQVYNSKSSINKQIIDFDISKLAAGIYFLRIQSDSYSTVKKLIVQ